MTGPVATGDPPDAALIEAARRGDLYAWESIVRRYQEPVFRVAYLVVRASDLAEKATQSTFIRAYRALPSLEAGTPVLPWLLRIVAGEARQQRRESSRPTSSSRPPERSTGPQMPSTPIPGMERAEQLTPTERAAIISAFDRLAEEDRLTIASRYLFGLSSGDAAAAMSIASGLVDEHLSSAMQSLRKRMLDN